MYSNSNTTILLLILIIMWTVLISSSFLTKSSTTIMAAGSRSKSIIRSCSSTSSSTSSSSSSGCRSHSRSRMIAAFVTNTQPQSITTTRQHQQQQLQQQQQQIRQQQQQQQQQQPLQQQPLQQMHQRMSTSYRLYSSSSGDNSNSNNIIDHNVKHFYNKDDDENKIRMKSSQLQSQSQSQQRQRILKQFDTTTQNDNNKSTEIEMERIVFEKQITIDTLDWLENVVIQYDLCPFAETSLLKNQLTIDVIQGSNQTEILTAVLSEALRLNDTPGTTLIVCPNLFPNNFIAYLEILNILTEGILPDHNLDGRIQIASFHPNFVFGDSDSDSNIENYTNRSPYPIFHLLREADVSYAVDSLDGDDSKVWKRNIAFLNTVEQTIFNTNTGDNDHDNDDDINNGNSDDNDNDIIDNKIIDTQQLLRSVFLKGKVSDYYSSKDNDTNNSNNNIKCPLSKIKQYEERIQETLKEFRTHR